MSARIFLIAERKANKLSENLDDLTGADLTFFEVLYFNLKIYETVDHPISLILVLNCLKRVSNQL